MSENDKEFANIFNGAGANGFPPGMIPEGVQVMVIGGAGMPSFTPMITGDEFAYNEDPNDKQFKLPQGMSLDTAITVLEQAKEDLETHVELDRKFLYRPDDGAVATDRVLKRKFGQTLNKGTMFSMAQARTVKTGVDELFDEIEEELRTNSIYRGKVLQGAETLEFKDMSDFDPKKYVFATDLIENLEGTLWSALRYYDQMKADGESVKRAVLAYGDYGTGKSTLGQITALTGVENGWTVIFARPGRDDIHDVLRTARLYGRTVVIYEDIDKDTEGGESMEVSELLEAFDGASSKNSEIVLFMTANHPEKIIKGMLRPGRIDGVFEVGSLDAPAVERLIGIKVPADKLGTSIDYSAIYTELEGYSPAFVNEAIKRTKTFAITRLGGRLDYVLETEDFVKSAKSLRDQYTMLTAAHEGIKKPALTAALEDTITESVKDALHHSQLQDNYGDRSFVLAVPGRNGLQPEYS